MATENVLQAASRNLELQAARREMTERREAQRVLRQKHGRNAVRADELAAIEAYLRSPVSVGYWRLTVKKKFDGPLLSYLASQYGVSPADLSEPLRADVPEESRATELKKVSTVMRALTLGMLFEDHGNNTRLTLEHGINRQEPFSGEYIAKNFAPLVQQFRQSIYFPDYLPTIRKGGLYRIASGVLILHGSWVDEVPTFLSTAKKPLEDLANLFTAAQLGHSELEKIFSPEDELFTPYFKFLQVGYDEIIKDTRIKASLTTAFEYFVANDFTHCISSLGLIAEDYLTQVFEYYFRIPCGKGNTLGQIYDQIHVKLREVTQPSPPSLGDIDALYKAINQLEATRDATEHGYEKKVESGLRDVLSLIKADRKYFAFRFDQMTKGTKRASMFPPTLNEDFAELIRYRNAASHKSRVPLGSFEALRTLYCLVTFVLWWHETRLSTDWQLPRDEILRAAAIGG